MHFIYKITNIRNQKIYIGFTSNIHQRFFDHFKHNRGKPKYLLGKSIKKYGTDQFTFEVIYQSPDKLHTKKIMEPLYIACYNSHYSTGHGYNMTYGGDGCTHTVETKRSIGDAARKRLSLVNNGAESTKLNYKITYDNGQVEEIFGLSKFMRDGGYSPTAIKLLLKNQRKFHKNIVKIERLAQ